MKQAEKTAKELVERFKEESVGSLTTELIKKFNKKYPDFNGSKWSALWKFAKLERAKQGALICLKRERALLSHLFCRGMLKQNDCTKMMKELEQVKQAINKL